MRLRILLAQLVKTVGVLVLLVRLPALANEAGSGKPQTVFYGYAAPEPARWQKKPTESVSVTLCAHGTPPSKGSVVTLVPAGKPLPTVTAHVSGFKKEGRGTCTVVTVEPVTEAQWLGGAWSKGGAWSYPRLIAIRGEQAKARAMQPASIAESDLPTGTRGVNVRIAVDVDGDGRVDAVARFACEDGRLECEEFGCQEVWTRKNGLWEREDRICGE